MKKTMVMTLLVSMLALAGAQAQGIAFHEGDWASALKKAKAEDKLIFMDCYTTWCGPCKMMAKSVFPEQSVGAFFNQHFVNVKMDMEKGEGRQLAQTYQVRAYPTLLFVDGDGKVVHKALGARQVADFIELGKAALKRNDKSAEYAALYEAGDRSAELLRKYAYALKAQKQPYAKVANEYLDAEPSFAERQDLQAVYDLVEYVDSKLYETMVAHKARIISEGIATPDDWSAKVLACAENTLNRAIEYQAALLLEQAKASVKAETNKAEGKYFAQRADVRYAAALKDGAACFKAANKWVRQSAKGNAKQMMVAAQLVVETSEVAKHRKKARRWAAQSVELLPTAQQYFQYAELLKAMGDDAAAKAAYNKARELRMKE